MEAADPQSAESRVRPGGRRVLVAGARRRVASELIHRLLRRPWVDHVVAVDRDRGCPAALIGCAPDRLTYLSADLSRRRVVDDLFMADRGRAARVDTVVHLAFEGDPRGYARDRHEFNVRTAKRLLDAALRHDVEKYVYLSSDAVYRLDGRVDFRISEDAELDLDPRAHPTLRDTLDAEFMVRSKMDHPTTEVMVLRPSGVFGEQAISGLNLLFDSRPPLLPIGFDPLVNPTTVERLAEDLVLSVGLTGKGVFNVAGSRVGPLSRFMVERGIRYRRVPALVLRPLQTLQRRLGRTQYDGALNPSRLFVSLVLDDRKFQRRFRDYADALDS